jgi:hypothetical protein
MARVRASWAHLEKHRVLTGAYASQAGDLFGAFRLGGLAILASSGDPTIPWEHVSVSRHDRPPTWAEMDKVKRLFWKDDEAVMQLHVPRSQHINVHPNCLHLWRPIEMPIPLPPKVAV